MPNVGKHKEMNKWYIIKHRYGIDKDEWYWMLKEQNFQCKICNRKLDAGNTANNVCIDHDHETGRVRGMLCKPCNSFIGLAQEDVSILNSAIVYLKEQEAYDRLD